MKKTLNRPMTLGKISPALLADEKKLYAYSFKGYWKDVGTIESLWEANMDLLNPNIPLNIKDPNFKIYARNYAQPPSFVSKNAKIDNSMVAEGCNIKGTVEIPLSLPVAP